jgi:CTP:molybdopterin cytidylyltransferase MocA
MQQLRKQLGDLLAQQVHRGVVVTGPQAGAWVQMLDRAQKKVKAAYLGVSASPVSAALRAQLALPQGIGLVVDAVEPDSPAAKAGLQQHDVLHKLNDQLLVNWEQLATLIRTFKAGDEVALHAIRQAKPVVLSAKLAEKEVPEQVGPAIDIEGMPGMALQQWLPDGFRLRPGEGGWDVLTARPGIAGRTAALSINDGNRALDITIEGGVPTVVARDAQGKLLFQGRLKTADDLKAVPDDIRRLLQNMQPKILTDDGLIRFPFEEPKRAAPTTDF